jgi:hypothetical protein
MAQTKFKLQILAEAQEDTKDLRRYILRSIGAETLKQNIHTAGRDVRQHQTAPAEWLRSGGDFRFWRSELPRSVKRSEPGYI